jgi:uncharacterized protein YraI
MLKGALLAGAMLVPGVASAATAAIVTTDLNVRTGPGVEYQRFQTIPAGDRVTVIGCLSGYNWCDVDWAGSRGWVSGSYLAYRQGGDYYDRPISSIGISIGIPVVGFDPYVYHDRYYRDRSWYRDRYLDDRRREARRDWREERREDRRDWREERREDRRDARRDRREDRRDDRGDWRDDDRRDDRRDAREDRRDRREAREERREDRRDRREAREQSPQERRRIDEARRDILEAWPGFRD